ncbi:MAG: YodL domain-containing protein [Waltera sp.]|uniref:YodL domain-containing protein n=1 Tax=Waltera sp. TaxID=2815806 RepID=UPI0039929BF5
MAESKTEKQKVQEITEKLEQGIKELFESEKYKTYLNTMSKFHNYSFNNTMLIAMQKPDATLVAGFKAWQKNFDRHVKKGEKGIRILAPAPYKIKEERDKIDPVTQELLLDKDGNPQKEEVEITIPAFRAVSVFDVAQTDGKPIPELAAKELLSDVEGYQDMIRAVEAISPVPIELEEIAGDSKGYYDREAKRIAVQENMSEGQTLKTMIHEVAHSKLHSKEVEQDEQMKKDRNTKEVEAESIAYTVCQHFGVDTSDYSFGYIAGWSSGRDTKELRASMDTIRRTASELITGIEEQLQEIQRNREVSQEQTKESILLIQNTDLSEFSLLDVYGMDRPELMQALSEMSDDDKLSIQAYLESKGAWTAEIGNQDSGEYGEYHLDVRYNTDTDELIDMKERKAAHDKAMQEELAESDSNREAQLLYGNTDKYGIYQLKDNPELDKFRFEGTESLKRMGITKDNFDAVLPENYKLVYMGELAELQGQTQSETLEAIYTKFNIDHPADYKAHSLSVSDIVVLHENGENTAHFVDSFGFTELPKFMLTLEGKENEIETELAVHIADRYILMHECEEGYDYSILDEQYHLLDGGVYDNPDITIRRAMDMVIANLKEPRFSAVTEQYYRDEFLQGEVYAGSEAEIVDFEELSEKAEEVEQADLEAKQAEFRENNPDVVADFRARTEELFHSLDGQSAEDIEKTVYAYVRSQIDEYGLDAEIVDVVVSGSRCRGIEKENSDLDVVVEYTGSTREDDLFNMLHEDSIYIAGIQVDINPITEGRTGTLETYLPEVETYLQEKAQQEQTNNQLVTQGRENALEQQPEKEKMIEEKTLSELEKEPVVEPETVHITFTVAECGEFHTMGEFHEGIETIEEAMQLYNVIDPSRMHGIPSLGVNMHIDGTEEWEDEEADIVRGNCIDVDFLNYTPELRDTPTVQDALKKLIAAYPDKEVNDRETKEAKIQTIATELDQLSYDIDTFEYRDSVPDREAQVQMIANDIRSGNVKPLQIFLQTSIDEGIDEDSERQAKELIAKLAEYKPLAKIEELEEQNYNMIDDRLNNGVEKFNREEEKKEQAEKPQARSSLKERLVAKQKEVAQGKKDSKEQEKSKNTHREM